jgi:hypothetical protein
MGQLALPDERWLQTAARSHTRFVLEAKGIRLEVSALLLASFAALPSHPGELAAATLRRLSLAQGLPDGAGGVQWPLFARSE